MSVSFKSFSLKSTLLAAGLGLAAAGSALAGAAGPGEGPQSPRDPAARIARHLSLDEAQKASVAAIFERNRGAQEALHQRGQTHREALRALKPGSANYSAQSQALADEAGTLARDRVLQQTQLRAELASVLTPEQLAKLDERMGRGHFGRGHGKGGKDGKDGKGGERRPEPRS